MSRRPYPPPGICIAALFVPLALAASGAAAAIHVQHLGRDRGLPSVQVHSVAEGPDGFRWFAGPAGLARYDGGHVVVFGSRDGLSTHGLRALALGGDGHLWIGSDAGVDRLVEGRFRPLLPGGWRHGVVEDLAAVADGMWIATNRGLFRWSDRGGLEEAGGPLLRDAHVAAVASVGGRVWAAGPVIGLLRGADGVFEPPGSAEWGEIAPVRTLAGSRRGSALVGGDRGLLEIESSGRVVGRLAEARPEAVSAILDLGEELWLGIGGQLRLYERAGGGWTMREIVLEETPVNHLAADAQGNIWVATDNHGAAKISVLRRAIARVDPPCSTPVHSIHRTRDGDFLIGGDACSYRLRSDLSAARRLEGLDRIKVWDLLEDRQGTVWVATGRGLYRGPRNGRLLPAGRSGDPLAAPGRVLLERGDAVWIGGLDGLWRVRGEEVAEARTAQGESLGYVYTLVEDARGRLWVGTVGHGLWRESAGGALEPVRLPGPAARGNVYSIAFGPAGETVVAQDGRLLLLREGEIRGLRVDGDPAVAAWSTLFDPAGDLWVGGSSGLTRYRAGSTVPEVRLGASAGLAGEEFTTSRSLALGPAGRLLCGLGGGLSVVTPRALDGIADLGAPELAEVTWSHAEPRLEGGTTVVGSGRWSFEGRVFAPWYVDEQSVLFRHRLRGLDEEWSGAEPAASHRIRYTTLPAGEYALEVQGFSPLGGWGPGVEVLALRVLPPWWLHPWALVAWVVLAVAAGFALWRTRVRALMRRTRDLERTVEARTAALREAMKTVEHSALHDELTGLPNQRSFWEQLRRRAAEARRYETSFALIVLDLDRFKRVNDLWGHRAGDRVLAFAAGRLQGGVRAEDVLARYGGEEFVVILTHGSDASMRAAAERLRQRLKAEPCEPAPGAPPLTLTASFGLALWQGAGDDPEELFRRADAALYAAKRGKDAVVTWSAELDEKAPSSPEK